MATTDRSEEQVRDPAPPDEAASPLQPDASLSPAPPRLGEVDQPDTAPAPGDPASLPPTLNAEPPGENGHEPDAAPDQAPLSSENGHAPDAAEEPLPVRRVRRVLLAQPHLDLP